MSIMICAFPHYRDPLSVQADVLFSTLSLSTSVGRFDGSGSPSPRPFFPSSTSFSNRPRCMHDRPVSAPHRRVLFLFLIRCRHHSSNDTTVEQCLSTSPTKSEVPTIIIFCIVASAGKCLLLEVAPPKKTEWSTSSRWPLFGKTQQTTTQSSSSSSAHS